MAQVERRLAELGLTLPEPIVPPGNYELVKLHGGLAYVAGHGPFDGPTPVIQGVSATTSRSRMAIAPRA